MHKMYFLVFVLSFGVIGASCTAPPSFVPVECDPDSFFPAPECIPDAGTDAGDAEAGADEPDGAQAAICPGRCVPEPSGASAGDWPRTPMLLWFGPRELAPANCDEARKLGGYGDNVEFIEKYRRYAFLEAPPAACACTCPDAGGVMHQAPRDDRSPRRHVRGGRGLRAPFWRTRRLGRLVHEHERPAGGSGLRRRALRAVGGGLAAPRPDE
ncbi:hypothetical protein [Polyangium fumosum]|uniref:Uncharacterized protein n=1 Tax=Polyangium fumosum TaxID=889272 RepID=A0A4U1JA95_9BACT|nr:hypothetical protein [Polyangium fumosum]TKD06226.1 hypothetical protein E8A74_20060 [Polyangium fumosum]